MLTKLLISLALLLAPVQLRAQTQVLPPVSKTMKETAAAELEAVIAEAGKLDDKLAIINVKARAAALVSLSDPVRSEMMFLEIWKFAKEQPDKDFDKEQALTLILKHIFPRNPKLAKQLLSEEAKPDESSLELRATGRDPSLRRTAKLASQLVDEDPRAASELLERNLSTGMTPAGLNALLRLREKDPLLSDFVVAKALDGLKAQPDVVSLSGLHLLTVYLFPEGNTVELNSSLQSLQIQYFSTTYDVLRASLAESEAALLKDQHYTQADLRFRAMYQARVSLTLAALAPRYRPGLSAELNALANKLVVLLPDNVAQLARLTAARLGGNQTVPDNPEMAIPLAISSGDFEEAGRLVDDLKSEELRKTYSQVLAKIEAKALLARSDVIGALTRIRKVEDQTARLALYLEAVKVAQKKRDAPLSSLVINEARTSIPQVDRNGLHVRALLAFASQLSALASTDEAVEFLDAAVVAINSLPKQSEEPAATKSPTELAWDEINDPRSLLDAPELDHAFSSIGAVDLERAINEARKIAVKPVQLVARLEAVGEVMRIDARRPRSKPATKAVTRSGQ
jgi:hypothetical protein